MKHIEKIKTVKDPTKEKVFIDLLLLKTGQVIAITDLAVHIYPSVEEMLSETACINAQPLMDEDDNFGLIELSQDSILYWLDNLEDEQEDDIMDFEMGLN